MVNFLVVVVLGSAVWHSASFSVHNAGEINAEAQSLVAFVGLVISSVLAWATYFAMEANRHMAEATKDMADEMRLERQAREQAARAAAVELAIDVSGGKRNVVLVNRGAGEALDVDVEGHSTAGYPDFPLLRLAPGGSHRLNVEHSPYMTAGTLIVRWTDGLGRPEEKRSIPR